MKGTPQELARTTYWLKTVLEGFLPIDQPCNGRLLDMGSADGHIAHFWADKGGLATYCHYELDACRQVAALYGIPLRRHQNEGLPEDGCWLRGVGETGLEVAFTDLAPAGPYTLATFDTRAYEATYALEMVGHIAAGLEHSGWLLSVIDEKISTSSWQDRLNTWFEEVEVITSLSPRARGESEVMTSTSSNQVFSLSCQEDVLIFSSMTESNHPLCSSPAAICPTISKA